MKYNLTISNLTHINALRFQFSKMRILEKQWEKTARFFLVGAIFEPKKTHTNLAKDSPAHGTITYPAKREVRKIIIFKRADFGDRGDFWFTSSSSSCRGVFTERSRGYDLLCIEGLVRALQVFKGVSWSDGPWAE